MTGGIVNQNVFEVKLDVLHQDVGEIKAALNELSKAITKLALVEQQQNQIAASVERAFKALSRIEDRITAQDDRIINLEKQQPQHTAVARWVDRALVALASVSALMIAKAAGMGS